MASLMMVTAPAGAKDYYVSAARGKGKHATKEKPAKDLGNILRKLKPGDVVHIAEGTYTGRGDNGTDIIKVPITIIGGYSDDFSTRDPWGAHKTILTGDNLSDNWQREPRIFFDLSKYREKEMPPIHVDGIIIDHSGRNRYRDASKQEIVRMANPKTKENPTPDQGGLVIWVSKTGNYDADAHWQITVENCVVMNTGGTQGALSVSGYKNSKVTIRNNLVINNTGTGIYAVAKFHGSEDLPEFTVENNTVLFSWKFDPSAQSYSGNSFKADNATLCTVQNNVFGFADRYGIHNAAKAEINLNENIIVGNVLADYLEFDTKMGIDEIEDESDYLMEAEGNVKEKIAVPIDKAWLKGYGGRVLIDRNAVEADIKVQMTAANELRSILGLPLQAGTVDMPSSPVWLHHLPVKEAIKAGLQKYSGKYGCSKP